MLSFENLTPSRYRSLGRIGRGGMAEVLLAATQSSGVTKLAVLKCLWPDLAEDPAFLEMFLDEARLSARLHHPNVVQTYEVVQHEGRLALAMEYLDGQSLKSVLARVSPPLLSLPARLRIITGVLAALEYAHALTDFDGSPLGVVHRDVSPHNVIVTYDGHVKLLDFGIAKTLAARHETRPGDMKGKLAYLAPEAIRGDVLDRRADVFSVGVMLWEILAGRRLWGRSSDSALAWRLTDDAPPPELPAGLRIPAKLRAVCMRALAPDPAERHQSAAELEADLEGFGVEGTDSYARRLGRVVSLAFEPERALRQALIESHLAHLASLAAVEGDEADYAAFELSAVADAPAPSAPRRGRTLMVAAAAAVIALASGVQLGQRVDAGALLRTWSGRLTPRSNLPARSPFETATTAGTEDTAEAPPPVIEPLAEPRQPLAERREDLVERRPERHARGAHAHRRRPLDLLSDDVLGLDGEPLAASAASSTAPARD